MTRRPGVAWRGVTSTLEGWEADAHTRKASCILAAAVDWTPSEQFDLLPSNNAHVSQAPCEVLGTAGPSRSDLKEPCYLPAGPEPTVSRFQGPAALTERTAVTEGGSSEPGDLPEEVRLT